MQGNIRKVSSGHRVSSKEFLSLQKTLNNKESIVSRKQEGGGGFLRRKYIALKSRGFMQQRRGSWVVPVGGRNVGHE